MNEKIMIDREKDVKPERISYKINKKINIHSDIDILVDDISIHLKSRGDAAILSFSKLSDVVAFVKLIKGSYLYEKMSLRSLKKVMNLLGITLYLHNRYFGLIGPKAGVILPTLLKLTMSSSK